MASRLRRMGALLALLPLAAQAQPGVTVATGTAPAAVQTTTSQARDVIPVTLVGRDIVAGSYCVVGSSSTCALLVSGGASSSSSSPAALGTAATPDVVGGSQGAALAQDSSNRLILPPITFASPQGVTQSGAWAVGLTGSLPAFASPPAVSVNNLPAVQPVSGTVTANQGGSPWSTTDTNSAAALSAAQTTANAQGAPASGVSQLSGGSGVLGWLSGLYKTLTGTLNVAGSVSVTNLPATQPVSGTVAVSNLPATQAVSGTVGVSSLPALAAGSNAIGSVSVSNLPTTQPVSGSVSVSNFPGTQPVSGSVSVSNFPATQPVSGSVAVSSLPALPAGSNALGSVSVSNFPATQSVTDPKDGQSSDEIAVRGGFGFVSSTGVVSVATANYLNVIITNPAGSGKYLILQGREVANSSTSVLTYTSRVNPTALTSPTTVTPANRYTGNASTSVASMTYLTSTSALAGGTAVASNIVAPQGFTDVMTIRVIPPGYSLGISIGGVGGVLTTASSIVVNYWWDEVAAP